MMPRRSALVRFLPVAAFYLLVAAGSSVAQTPYPNAPSYSAQSIVHAATQTAQALAPNTIATIYGSNLSLGTMAANANSITAATLPESLGGVSVVVNGLIANLFYVSPTQINFLIPYELTAGTVNIFVALDGLAGPLVPIQLNATAPGLFLYNGFVIATHLNGTLISPAAPASGGEIIVVYIAGLGRTAPDTSSGKLVTSAATIVAAAQTQVLLQGKPCPQSGVLYVGLAPGFAGLYQINMIVPPLTPSNPEFRVQVGAQISPPGTLLALQ